MREWFRRYFLGARPVKIEMPDSARVRKPGIHVPIHDAAKRVRVIFAAIHVSGKIYAIQGMN